MIRRIPILPTLVVLVAVGVMVRLGFWQLDRLHEKEALLERYAAAGSTGDLVPWSLAGDETLYRRSQVDCVQVREMTAIAGGSAAGEPGMAHLAECRLPDGSSARVVLGWSRDPAAPKWTGGAVVGTIAPGPRLVADPPLAGLEANARPDPSSIPNNHLAYAVQWFLFALTALVVYGLALRKRLRP